MGNYVWYILLKNIVRGNIDLVCNKKRTKHVYSTEQWFSLATEINSYPVRILQLHFWEEQGILQQMSSDEAKAKIHKFLKMLCTEKLQRAAAIIDLL